MKKTNYLPDCYWSRFSKMLLYAKAIFILTFVSIYSASASNEGVDVINKINQQQDEHIVKGTVIDATGMPIPGVSVSIKGTTTGTITDIDGNYSLSVEGKDVTILFSFIGFENKEVIVGGKSTINITLVEEVTGLDEVIVVGYGAQQKKTLTGSVGNISSEKMTTRPAANTTELLQGRVSGMSVLQSSGLPGDDGATIRIRGFSGSPLVLIDGVQGSLGHVDPNDIESISVLKDASAAIYGARAGDGVILVTTKRGADRDAQISYHGTYSFTNLTYLPERVNATQWAELMHESGQDVNAATPHHVEYDPERKILVNTLNGNRYNGYNWQDAIIKDWQPQQQHNLSASGGTERIKYYVSAGFTDQESNFKSGDYSYNRYNLRSNIDAQINDNLSVKVDFAYRQNTLDKANFDVGSMLLALETANPSYPIVHAADPEKATFSGFLERSPYYQTMKKYSGTVLNKTNAMQGALELKYDFPMIKGLSAKARIAYEDIFILNKNVSKPFDVWRYNEIAAQAGTDPWTKEGTQNTNRISVYNEREIELMPSFVLDYTKSIGDHNLKGMLISETIKWKEQKNGGSRKNLLSFETPYLSFGSEEGIDNHESEREEARSSIIGRINYDYKGKYMLEFAMRADASGEYAEEGRWGYFPSVSAGWRLSEEAFISDNFSAVDNLKLRASYGKLGKDDASSFDYLTGYNVSSGSYIFGSTPAPIISSAGLANPNVTWTNMTMYNVGMDGTFWNGLLGFEADVFYRLREDLLAYPTEGVPSTFGASLPKTNLNSDDTRGFELRLTHRNKIGQVTYDVSPMISWSRSKWVKYQEDISEDPEWNKRYLREGEWNDRRWGYVSEGLFMNQDEIDNYAIDQDQNGNQSITIGDIKYKDLNNDDIIDWRDQDVIGKSGMPNWNYSLDLGAEYKGFRLSALLTGQAGYSLAPGGAVLAPFVNGSTPLELHYHNRSIIGTDENGQSYITNPGAKLPPVNQIGYTANNGKTSDFWVKDAMFVRVKNINLSYSLPSNLVKKAGIKNCSVYMSATNMWTFSNLGIYKDAIDPEVPLDKGSDGRYYPPVRTMTLGLRLTL